MGGRLENTLMFHNLILIVPMRYLQARLYSLHNSEMQASCGHPAGKRHSLYTAFLRGYKIFIPMS